MSDFNIRTSKLIFVKSVLATSLHKSPIFCNTYTQMYTVDLKVIKASRRAARMVFMLFSCVKILQKKYDLSFEIFFTKA